MIDHRFSRIEDSGNAGKSRAAGLRCAILRGESHTADAEPAFAQTYSRQGSGAMSPSQCGTAILKIKNIKNQYRLGIDAGATFTTFIRCRSQSARCVFSKHPPTPNNPTAAIRDGLKMIEEEAGLTPEYIAPKIDRCVNGSTVVVERADP